MALTYEQVADAAAKLEADGIKVTSRNIRTILPCSPNELGPLLNDWKQGRQKVKSADIVLDPSITVAIIKQVQTAVDEATASVEDRLKDMQEELTDTQTEGRAQAKTIQELRQQLEAAAETIQQHENTISILTSSLNDTKATLIRVGTEKEEAIKKLGTAEQQVAGIPDLNRRITELTADIAKERSEKEAATIENIKINAELAHLRNKLTELQTSAASSADTIKALTTERDAQREKAHKAEVETMRLTTVEKATQELIAQLKANAAALQASLDKQPKQPDPKPKQ